MLPVGIGNGHHGQRRLQLHGRIQIGGIADLLQKALDAVAAVCGLGLIRHTPLAAGEDPADGIQLILQLPVFGIEHGVEGLAEHEAPAALPLGGLQLQGIAVEAEADVVDVLAAHDHQLYIELVAVLIPGRIEADLLALGVLLLQLPAALPDVAVAGGHMGKLQDVGVGLLVVGGGGDHEGVGDLTLELDIELLMLAEDQVMVPGLELPAVLLTGGQLTLDLLHGGVSALVEPGGELSGALLAAVAVLQLLVTQQSDLAAAEVTYLFLK